MRTLPHVPTVHGRSDLNLAADKPYFFCHPSVELLTYTNLFFFFFN